MQPEIAEYSIVESVPKSVMDRLWADGWRHFGTYFYRYSEVQLPGEHKHVLPLRIVLDRFAPSKSQRRVLRRNADLTCRPQRAVIDDDRRALFALHKQRFKKDVPPSLETFLGDHPEQGPCFTVELGFYAPEGQLVAASYLDIGNRAVSSIYAMFDLAANKRSLGIHTMLAELAYARQLGCQYYYPGYAYREPSAYDYKKRFRGLEYYDWHTWSASPPDPIIPS